MCDHITQEKVVSYFASCDDIIKMEVSRRAYKDHKLHFSVFVVLNTVNFRVYAPLPPPHPLLDPVIIYSPMLFISYL